MIARALDYVGIDDYNHGHRVGYIAYECAKKLEWAESRQEFVFFAGLLHDCGVSSGSEQKRLLGDLDPKGPKGHCMRGHQFLDNCVVLRPFAEACRYHHTPWHKLKDLDIDPVDRDAAALIFLADRVDTIRKGLVEGVHPDTIILHSQRIVEEVQARSGTLFKPEYCQALVELVELEGFWYSMNQEFIEDIGISLNSSGTYDMRLSIAEVINLAMFLSRIGDAKSPFTSHHSERVALIASELSAEMNLSEWDQKQIQVAGLLHDVGKLGVPDEILEKKGKLDDSEFARMKRHIVDTRMALRWCFKDSPIPDWAANHHERLDGTGYPYRLTEADLDLPSRIMAVADIFQALAQKRPYRERMEYPEILKIMTPLAANGKIDGDVFGVIQNRIDDYYELATG